MPGADLDRYLVQVRGHVEDLGGAGAQFLTLGRLVLHLGLNRLDARHFLVRVPRTNSICMLI